MAGVAEGHAGEWCFEYVELYAMPDTCQISNLGGLSQSTRTTHAGYTRARTCCARICSHVAVLSGGSLAHVVPWVLTSRIVLGRSDTVGIKMQ